MWPSILRRLDSLRCFWLAVWFRMNGARIGPGCRFGRRVKVGRGVVLGSGVFLQNECLISGRVRLGNRVVVQKFAELTGNIDVADETVIGSYSFISTMPRGDIRIGARVLVNSFNVIGAGEHVLIGDDCIFAPYVQITDSNHRFEFVEDSPRHDAGVSEAVEIGRGVWLGSGVKVLIGVKIGEGVVVGAGAVVSRSLPAMAIAVGIPAKAVRTRISRDGKEMVTA